MRETQHIELKSNFDDMVIETLTAFANTKGGKVYYIQPALKLDENADLPRDFKEFLLEGGLDV